MMTDVEKMMRALLRKDNLIRWVGGYVYGRTSNDDPFIILYAPQEVLKEKVVRVYEQDFKKLPDFVNTAVPANITNDGNPNKDKARRQGIYIECPAFEILVYHGKETQMGPEIRFDDVLRVTTRTKHYGNEQQPQAQQVPVQAERTGEITRDDMWLMEAINAKNDLMFDSAIVNLRPFFKDATTAGQFRETLFPGGFDSRYADGMTGAMLAYADGRTNDKTHATAKAAAYDAFRKKEAGKPVPAHLLKPAHQPALINGAGAGAYAE